MSARVLLIPLLTVACATTPPHITMPESHLPPNYTGKPFTDSRFTTAPQKVPGVVFCAYYDTGGEGVAYHETTPENQGSGKLNPLDGDYHNEFRHTEAVDISYTKYSINADNSPFNRVLPPDKLLYVGWTEPTEWFSITIDVAETADYSVDLLYTSHHGGAISFDLNHTRATHVLPIQSTHDDADPLAWRQWHHWNIAKGIATLHLKRGLNLITLRTEEQGSMNYATLTFRAVTPK